MRRFASSLFRKRFSTSSDKFYRVQPEIGDGIKKTIRGEVIDNAVDLKTIRPGEMIEVPYEITVSHSLRDFWQSAFYSHDRINTSTPFARNLNLQDQVIPFGLMLFLAGSMSHADHAKLQTGFSNARYLWPAFAGDTFKKRFLIRSLRSTSDGRHSIFTIDCELRNQRGAVVFTCEKTMLFPFKVPPSDVVVKSSAGSAAGTNDFLSHLVAQAETLQSMGSQTLAALRPGQLIVHTLTRPLSETHMMQVQIISPPTPFNRTDSFLLSSPSRMLACLVGLVSASDARAPLQHAFVPQGRPLCARGARAGPHNLHRIQGPTRGDAHYRPTPSHPSHPSIPSSISILSSIHLSIPSIPCIFPIQYIPPMLGRYRFCCVCSML